MVQLIGCTYLLKLLHAARRQNKILLHKVYVIGIILTAPYHLRSAPGTSGAVMQLEAAVAAAHARATVSVWELRSLQQFSLCAFVTAHEQIEHFHE